MTNNLLMITRRDILVCQGVPVAATIEDLPREVSDDTITSFKYKYFNINSPQGVFQN